MSFDHTSIPISTLTKDRMLETIENIINSYDANGDKGKTKDTAKGTSKVTLMNFIENDLNREEAYIIQIEEYVNNCIKKKKEAYFFTKGFSYIYNKVLSIVNHKDITSTKFVEHANNYDYSDIDFIGKLYIKVVLYTLYQKLKNEDSQIDYSSKSTFDSIASKFNLDSKLHSSIQFLLSTDQLHTKIAEHSKLYYSNGIENPNRLYHLDSMIANTKLNINEFYKEINKEYKKFEDILEDAYPNFESSNSLEFLRYYKMCFYTTNYDSQRKIVKYTVVSLILSSCLLYCVLPTKAIADGILRNLGNTSHVTLDKSIIEKLISFLSNNLPSFLKYRNMSKFVNLSSIGISKELSEMDKGQAIFVINSLRSMCYSVYAIIAGLNTYLSVGIINYIYSRKDIKLLENKIIKKYSTFGTTQYDILSKMYLACYDKTGNVLYDKVEVLHAYYTKEIRGKAYENLQLNKLYQIKFDKYFIKLNTDLEKYEQERFDMLIS